MTKRQFIAVGFLIVFAGGALRLAGLGPRSLWIDELVTRNVGELPFWKPGAMIAQNPARHSIVSFALHDKGPGPLIYLVEGMFARLAKPFGHEYWLRVPAVFAGILTLILILIFGPRLLGGRGGALLLAAAVATLPLCVEWSTSARGYSWGLLIVFCEIGLLTELSKPGQQTRTWLILLALYSAGWMLNPLMTFWNAGLLCGILYARVAIPRSSMASIRPGFFWSPLAAALAANVAYMAVWLVGVHYFDQTAANPAGGMRDAFIPFFRGIIENPMDGVMQVAALALPALALLPRKRRHLAPVLAAILVGYVAQLPMFATLLNRHFLAPRYFFAMIGCVLFLLAIAANDGFAWVRKNFGHHTSQATVCAAVGLLILLPARTSLQVATTPTQDWSGAVRYLKSHLGPRDVILPGPNSDIEMLWEYGIAAGIPKSRISRVYITNRHGLPSDSLTPEGLAALLHTDWRLWFVTPFWNQARSPEYWQLANQNFHEAATIPGGNPIRIMLHEPGPRS